MRDGMGSAATGLPREARRPRQSACPLPCLTAAEEPPWRPSAPAEVSSGQSSLRRRPATGPRTLRCAALRSPPAVATMFRVRHRYSTRASPPAASLPAAIARSEPRPAAVNGYTDTRSVRMGCRTHAAGPSLRALGLARRVRRRAPHRLGAAPARRCSSKPNFFEQFPIAREAIAICRPHIAAVALAIAPFLAAAWDAAPR